MDPMQNVATIARESGLAGAELADELVARGIAPDRQQALLMVDLEVDDGDGDVELVD